VRVCAGSTATSRICAKCTTSEVLDHRDLVKRNGVPRAEAQHAVVAGQLPDDLWLRRLQGRLRWPTKSGPQWRDNMTKRKAASVGGFIRKTYFWNGSGRRRFVIQASCGFATRGLRD
jgi:hypothetical protein